MGRDMLTVRLKFEDQEEEQLTYLDSCATINLIAREKANGVVPLEKDISGVVPNATMKILGTVTKRIVMDQGNAKIPIDFSVVENLPTATNYLIGFPSWKKLKISYNAETNDVTIGKSGHLEVIQSERTKIENDSANEEIGEVTCKSDVTISPGTRKFVQVKFDVQYLKKQPGAEAIVTPSCWIDRDPQVKLVPGRVTMDTKGVFILNMSDKSVQIQRGTTIGYLTTGQYEVLLLDIDEDHAYIPTVEPEWSEKEFMQFVEPNLNTNLTQDQRETFKSLLLKYKNLFSTNPRGPGVITKTEAHVPLNPGTVPIRMRPYRTSEAANEELRKQIKEMMANGIIRKSTSAWGFPVVLAIKPDGSWRFCVDYSKLSQHVKRDTYVLPRVDDHLDRLKKAKHITVIDMASGFWQIPIKEEDKEKLAFVTTSGNYEFNVLPFGFCNSSAIFQKAIEETLDPLLYICCLAYIDDVAIYSENFEKHLEDCQNVFSLLNQYRWKIKIQKCQFAMEEFNYLGHRVRNGEIRPLESNIGKLKSMKVPKNPEELASLLGFMGYYKRFIQGYDYLTTDLRKLMHKNAIWEWKNEHQLAFEALISKLAEEPILKLPDLERQFIVKSDASQTAWGAALVQLYVGLEHPVSFASGVLNKHQKNWPIWKRECYGAVRAILQWQHYLLGTKFRLVTDHSALLSILDPNKSFPPIIVGWIVTLSSFSFQIEHRPGKELVIEDGLSRPEEHPEFVLMVTATGLVEAQKKDQMIIEIIESIESGKPLSAELEKITNCNANHFILEDGILFYLESPLHMKKRRLKRFVIAAGTLHQVLNGLHCLPCGGHLGLERLFAAASKLYWTPNMYQLVKKYFLECEICEKNRLMKQSNTKMLHIEATSPMEVVEADHIEMKVESNGNLYILTVTDIFSKKVWFIPTKTLGAEETLQKMLEHVFAPNRFPLKVISDHGTAFENELMAGIAKMIGIEHQYNLPYEKRKGSTGAVENKNKLCWEILRKYTDQRTQDDWSKFCWTAAYAYNKAPHPQLRGMSPDFVFHGLEAFAPFDVLNSKDIITKDEHFYAYRMRLSESWAEASKAQKEYHEKMDRKREKELNNRKVPTYQAGDWVLLRNNERSVDKSLKFKLASRNIGPFQIKKVLSELNHAILKLSSAEELEVHLDDVRHYRGKITSTGFKGNRQEIIIVERVAIEKVQLTDQEILQACFDEKENALYDIKSIVGKRVALFWPTHNRYYIGIIIGYNTNLITNLVHYFGMNDEGVEGDINFFKAYLYRKQKRNRLDKWRVVNEEKYQQILRQKADQ